METEQNKIKFLKKEKKGKESVVRLPTHWGLLVSSPVMLSKVS